MPFFFFFYLKVQLWPYRRGAIIRQNRSYPYGFDHISMVVYPDVPQSISDIIEPAGKCFERFVLWGSLPSVLWVLSLTPIWRLMWILVLPIRVAAINAYIYVYTQSYQHQYSYEHEYSSQIELRLITVIIYNATIHISTLINNNNNKQSNSHNNSSREKSRGCCNVGA